MIKRALSVILPGILLLSCLFAQPICAGEGYRVLLGYANGNWSVQEWGVNVNTSVTGAGTYSLTFNAASADTSLLVMDIVGAAEDFASGNIRLTALSILVDGNEIPVDISKVITGDTEGKGNFHIEIYNAHGMTGEDPPLDPSALHFTNNLTVIFTIGVLSTDTDPTDDPTGSTAPSIPILPTEPSDPTNPSYPTHPTDSTEPTEFSDPTVSGNATADPAESTVNVPSHKRAVSEPNFTVLFITGGFAVAAMILYFVLYKVRKNK